MFIYLACLYETVSDICTFVFVFDVSCSLLHAFKSATHSRRAENPALTNVLRLKPRVGQNVATHASPTSGNFFFIPSSTFSTHSPRTHTSTQARRHAGTHARTHARTDACTNITIIRTKQQQSSFLLELRVLYFQLSANCCLVSADVSVQLQQAERARDNHERKQTLLVKPSGLSVNLYRRLDIPQALAS